MRKTLRPFAVVLGGAASCLALAACGPAMTASLETADLPEVSRAVITAAPAGQKQVDPNQPVIVTADGGHLSAVSVSGPKGPVDGELSDDGSTWQASPGLLDYDSRYEIVATAVDSRGVETTSTEQFRTVEPKAFVSGWIAPGDGEKFGVGMPITVTFDRDIKDRAAVERALVVRTPQPLTGAWSWTNDRVVQFRPEDYWPGKIDIEVDADIEGVEVAKGVFGGKNFTSTFSTGKSTVIKVDAKKHTLKVLRDGKSIRTIPITTGKDGFETRSGTKVIITKEPTRLMDAATGGTSADDPEYYRLEVQYAMRITYSGEFLHAAPWSVGSQGYANVSHGCVGMSTDNAAWLFDEAQIGDPVEIRGTSVPQNLGNGITVWTQTWEDWLKDSALGAVQTQPLLPVDATPSTAPSSNATAPTVVDSTPADTPSGSDVAAAGAAR